MPAFAGMTSEVLKLIAGRVPVEVKKELDR